MCIQKIRLPLQFVRAAPIVVTLNNSNITTRASSKATLVILRDATIREMIKILEMETGIRILIGLDNFTRPVA